MKAADMNDLDLRLGVAETFKQAAARIDGIAMYCAMVVFLAGAALFGLTDFWIAFTHTPRWKFVWGAISMVPLLFLFYVSLALWSLHGRVSRVINALMLLATPVFFYWKLL
jgi:hypothetical protein